MYVCVYLIKKKTQKNCSCFAAVDADDNNEERNKKISFFFALKAPLVFA